MITIPDHLLADAPRVWIQHGPGMRSKVIDPVWRRRTPARLQAEALGAFKLEPVDPEVLEAQRQVAIERARAQRVKRETRRAERDLATRLIGMRPMRRIVEIIAARHECSGDEVLGERQFDRLTAPRQHAAYELRREGHSLSAIGVLMRRDHTTILASIRRWPSRARTMGIDCEPLPDDLTPSPKEPA